MPNCNDPKSKIPEGQAPGTKKRVFLIISVRKKQNARALTTGRRAPIFGEQANFRVDHCS
jgi:hypothetical protein